MGEGIPRPYSVLVPSKDKILCSLGAKQGQIRLRLVGHCDYPTRRAGADARKEESTGAERAHRDEMDTQGKKSNQGEEDGSTQQLKRSQGEDGC